MFENRTDKLLASWEDRAEWNIEPFLSERMGKAVSVPVKRPCIHKFIWLGDVFRIMAYAVVYSRGIEGPLEAVVLPASVITVLDTSLFDEKDKKALQTIKDDCRELLIKSKPSTQ